MSKYQWQGQNVTVKHGYASIKKSEAPLMWWNYEVSLSSISKTAIVPAIQVTVPAWQDEQEQVFIIANHHGVGEHKIKSGGHPNFAHYDVPDNAYFEEGIIGKIKKFSLDKYLQHEENRRQWQLKTHPKDMAKFAKLHNSIRGF